MKKQKRARTEYDSILGRRDSRLEGSNNSKTDRKKVEIHDEACYEKNTMKKQETRREEAEVGRLTTKTIPLCEEENTGCNEIDTRKQTARK